MRRKLSKIIIIVGIILLLISLVDFAVKWNNINKLNTPYLKNLRESYSNFSDKEYEEILLPLNIETSKSNNKVRFFNRFFIIVLATLILAGLAQKEPMSFEQKEESKQQYHWQLKNVIIKILFTNSVIK